MTSSRPAPTVLVCLLAITVGSCADSGAGDPADTIFFGDDIVTMDPALPTVEAVAVRGETIVAAGAMDDVMALRGGSTRVVDLAGKALLPGFIDVHGHFLATGRRIGTLTLHPPPVGDVETLEHIVRKIRTWIEDHDITPGQTVTGSGYDDSSSRRQPRRSSPVAAEAMGSGTSARRRRSIELSSSYGTTTVQNGGGTNPEWVRRLREAAAQEPFHADVAVLASAGSILDGRLQYEEDYTNGLRVAGVKFVLDGSPQGRTAWMTRAVCRGAGRRTGRLHRLRQDGP